MTPGATAKTWWKRLTEIIAPRPELLPELAPEAARRHVRLFAILSAAFIAIAYLLLVNAYWHFSPDSGAYLSLAQSIRAGQGYVIRGMRETKYPGGAPYFLVLLLKVSNSFLWLNLAQCAIMLASLGILYAALRLVAERATAVLVILLTAILFWVHEYAVAQKSEPIFFFFSSLSVLLLLLLARSESRRGRALLLVGLLAVWTLSFWCRVVTCFWFGPFVLALLLAGRALHPLRNRIANASLVAVVILATLGVYFYWGKAAKIYVGQPSARATTAWLENAPPSPEPIGLLPHRVWTSPTGGERGYDLHFNLMRNVRRIPALARWVPLILFPPWEAAGSVLPDALVYTGSLLCFLIVLLGCWRALRCGQVLVATSLIFLIPFLMSGPGFGLTHGRYIIGLAAFVVLLFLLGLAELGAFAQKRIHPRLSRRLFVGAGIVAILVPNAALLAGDIWVQRQPDYYRAFRGGVYSELMGITKWLGENAADQPVAAHDVNVLRALPTLTTCRPVTLPVRVNQTEPQFVESLTAFARRSHVRYAVTFNWRKPWPVWQLRPRPSNSPDAAGPYWQLWEYSPTEDAVRKLTVPPVYRWPARLPLNTPAGPISTATEIDQDDE